MALEVLLLNILYLFVDAQYARIGYMLEKFKFALKPLEGSDEDVVQPIFLSSVVSQFIIITIITFIISIIFIIIIEIHICIFNKMQKTGFKHKYPTIEFNSENPKKEC